MTPDELRCGWVFGHEETTQSTWWRRDRAANPRRALEADLRRHLAGGRVAIAFSGGRDSSLLLAMAADVARREQLPEPIAVTLRHESAPASIEDSWQHTVLSHLGLEAMVIDVDAESDIISPDAVQVMRTHGVCWSPGMFVRLPMFKALSGQSITLLTGEGGDEILAARRITPISRALRWRRPPRGRRRQECWAALEPRRLQRRRLARRASDSDVEEMAWLSSEDRRYVSGRFADEDASEPLGHAAATAWLASRRALTVALRHSNALAATYGVALRHPLAEPNFTRVLEAHGGFMGTSWLTRTEMMKQLAADLLPDAVLARTSKAQFNEVAFASHSRDFVSRWDGSGLEHLGVDTFALRHEWRRADPHAASFALLQTARLAQADW